MGRLQRVSVPLDLYLLIGLSKEGGHWNPEFVSEIQKRLNPRSITRLDLPGSGNWREHPEGRRHPWSIPESARIMRALYSPLLEAQKAGDSKRILIAISLGGMVGLEWIRQFPQDFDGLVIINSSMRGISKLPKRIQPQAMARFFQIFLTPSPERKERLVLDLCSNHPERSEKIHPQWVQIAKERPMHWSNLIRQTVAGARFQIAEFPNIPRLILASKGDRLAHYECSVQLHEVWSAVHPNSSAGKLRVIDEPHVGHAFHIDDPGRLTLEIQQWIETQSWHPEKPNQP